MLGRRVSGGGYGSRDRVTVRRVELVDSSARQTGTRIPALPRLSLFLLNCALATFKRKTPLYPLASRAHKYFASRSPRCSCRSSPSRPSRRVCSAWAYSRSARSASSTSSSRSRPRFQARLCTRPHGRTTARARQSWVGGVGSVVRTTRSTSAAARTSCSCRARLGPSSTTSSAGSGTLRVIRGLAVEGVSEGESWLGRPLELTKVRALTLPLLRVSHDPPS